MKAEEEEEIQEQKIWEYCLSMMKKIENEIKEQSGGLLELKWRLMRRKNGKKQ